MPADVLTNRNSSSRTGVTSGETLLTKELVSPSTFGKLFTRTVDGDLYAQPLIVSNLEIGPVRGSKPGHVAFTGAISQIISALTEVQMDVVADIDLRAGLAVTAQTSATAKSPASQAHAIFSRVKVT